MHFSVGAVINEDGDTDAVAADDLLRRGDLAMYSAKRAGGSRVAIYEDDFSPGGPAAETRTGALSGAGERSADSSVPTRHLPANRPDHRRRALARWRQPDTGAFAPTEFVQLAEETGQIRQLDRQIAERAVARCAELLRDRSREFHLAINVRPRRSTRGTSATSPEPVNLNEAPLCGV